MSIEFSNTGGYWPKCPSSCNVEECGLRYAEPSCDTCSFHGGNLCTKRVRVTYEDWEPCYFYRPKCARIGGADE